MSEDARTCLNCDGQGYLIRGSGKTMECLSCSGTGYWDGIARDKSDIQNVSDRIAEMLRNDPEYIQWLKKEGLE